MFFSEYVEGSSNNKALEIYNATGAPVDLAAGGLFRGNVYFNGSTSAGATVIALRGASWPTGTLLSWLMMARTFAVLAQADQTSTSSFFNGDDAVVLRKDGVIIDSIGQIGVDPGNEWGSGLTRPPRTTRCAASAAVCAGDGEPRRRL